MPSPVLYVREYDPKAVSRIKAKIELAAGVTVSLVELDEEEYGPDCWWARAVTESTRQTTTGYALKGAGDGWGAGPTIALDRLALALGLPDEFKDDDAKSLEHHSIGVAAE